MVIYHWDDFRIIFSLCIFNCYSIYQSFSNWSQSIDNTISRLCRIDFWMSYGNSLIPDTQKT